MQQYDIAIVGGGMIGLTLALGLDKAGLNVAVLNNAPITRELSAEPELRVSAINYANQQALTELGAWAQLDAARLSPYSRMAVWDKDSFGHIEFDGQEFGYATLGHIVENQALVNALAAQVNASSNITCYESVTIAKQLQAQQERILMLDNDDSLSCRLLVGADGANSQIRQQSGFPLTFKDYEHLAIVATIRTEQPHGQCARQAFTPTGPLALLPLADPHLCSIVWSQQTNHAQGLMALNDEAFNRALQVASNAALGQLKLDSERGSFPLTMRYARQWLDNGVVIIGDAAHTIHPLAGQGANLGMQDALQLASTIAGLIDAGKPWHEARYLREFERSRKAEAAKMIAAMEGFKQAFSGSNPVKKLLRGVGLNAANVLPGVKQQLVAKAMGL